MARWWGGLDNGPALGVGGVAAVVTLLVVNAAARLYFVNIYSPFGSWGEHGTLVSFLLGVLAGALVLGLLWAAARLSSVLVVLAVLALGAGIWVLTPKQIDSQESWVESPNQRWSCSGLSFDYYPPGWSDYFTTTYCVGVEKRIADG